MGGLPLATGMKLCLRLGSYGLPVVEQRNQNDSSNGVPQRRRKQETKEEFPPRDLPSEDAYHNFRGARDAVYQPRGRDEEDRRPYQQ